MLTADSLPTVNQVDLSRSRLDVVNNYHARMLASAILAAEDEHLEYVQLVSFGCGHDAYLTDEILRMMKEISGKIPLVLKIDESDNPGPLGIRVRSFAETVNMRRKQGEKKTIQSLPEPYPVKFTKQDRKDKVVLWYQTHPMLSAVCCQQPSKGRRFRQCRWRLAGRKPSALKNSMYIMIFASPRRSWLGKYWRR